MYAAHRHLDRFFSGCCHDHFPLSIGLPVRCLAVLTLCDHCGYNECGLGIYFMIGAVCG